MNLDEIISIPGLLSDADIIGLCANVDLPMIHPFHDKMTEKGTISYGLSSYGYDVTLAPVFKVFEGNSDLVIDPKHFDDQCCVEYYGDTCIIPPNSLALGYTNEYFNIPKDVLSICLGKSTYARCGIHVLTTPLESGWSGQVVIEIANLTPNPVKIYANEGIAQFLFIKGASQCKTPYNARGGKYMHQTGITLPKILE